MLSSLRNFLSLLQLSQRGDTWWFDEAQDVEAESRNAKKIKNVLIKLRNRAKKNRGDLNVQLLNVAARVMMNRDTGDGKAFDNTATLQNRIPRHMVPMLKVTQFLHWRHEYHLRNELSMADLEDVMPFFKPEIMYFDLKRIFDNKTVSMPPTVFKDAWKTLHFLDNSPAVWKLIVDIMKRIIAEDASTSAVLAVFMHCRYMKKLQSYIDYADEHADIRSRLILEIDIDFFTSIAPAPMFRDKIRRVQKTWFPPGEEIKTVESGAGVEDIKETSSQASEGKANRDLVRPPLNSRVHGREPENRDIRPGNGTGEMPMTKETSKPRQQNLKRRGQISSTPRSNSESRSVDDKPNANSRDPIPITSIVAETQASSHNSSHSIERKTSAWDSKPRSRRYRKRYSSGSTSSSDSSASNSSLGTNDTSDSSTAIVSADEEVPTHAATFTVSWDVMVYSGETWDSKISNKFLSENPCLYSLDGLASCEATHVSGSGPLWRLRKGNDRIFIAFQTRLIPKQSVVIHMFVLLDMKSVVEPTVNAI